MGNERAYDDRKNVGIDRVEVMSRAERRRQWTNAQKHQILLETLEPGATLAAVGKRHDVSAGLIYAWRKQALAGAVSGFVPVTVSQDGDAGSAAALAIPEPPSVGRRGLIEIELGNGVRLRVDREVDGGALRRVIIALDGR